MIKVFNENSFEVLKRLKGIRGYLSSLGPKYFDNPRKTQELYEMTKAINECESRIMHVAPTTRA